jgi:hypothetical protein
MWVSAWPRGLPITDHDVSCLERLTGDDYKCRVFRLPRGNRARASVRLGD